MHAATFFTELAALMRDNPPRLKDRCVVERMRAAGLLYDTEPAWAGLDVDVRRAAAVGAPAGLARIMVAAEPPARGAAAGTSATARRARDGLPGPCCRGVRGPGGGAAADELPAFVCSDSEGRPLGGRHRYELRFPREAAAARPRLLDADDA